jgi:hypothetical protein
MLYFANLRYNVMRDQCSAAAALRLFQCVSMSVASNLDFSSPESGSAKNNEMTELQRLSLEHLERARREGLSIKGYARAHEISAQQIYDTVGRLRRRGALPKL